jgi:hypothetical protein
MTRSLRSDLNISSASIIRRWLPLIICSSKFVKNNPTPIKIGKSLLGGFGVSEVQARTGVNIYEELSRRTFDVGMARYSAQMGESGGFFTMASSS